MKAQLLVASLFIFAGLFTACSGTHEPMCACKCEYESGSEMIKDSISFNPSGMPCTDYEGTNYQSVEEAEGTILECELLVQPR